MSSLATRDCRTGSSKQIVFVTGSGGKIGSLLLDSLKGAGYTVRALFHGDSAPRYKNQDDIGRVMGNLLEPESYGFALEGASIVIHTAGITHTNDIRQYYRVNSYGTLELVRLCRYYGVKRFIFISTRAISMEGGHYSYSKSIAEKYVRQSGLKWVVLRLGEVYGGKGNKGIDAVLNNIERFPVVPIVGRGRYSIMPLHISDAVLSIMKVLERDDLNDKVYTIAGPEVMTYNEFINRVLAVKRTRRIKIHIPVFMVKILLGILGLVKKNAFLVKDQLPRLCCEKASDISLAASEFGFAPAKMSEAMLRKAL